MLTHFQEGGASSCVMVAWEDKHYNPKCLLFFLLPPALIAERDAIWHGISLRLAALSLPNFSHTLAYLLGGQNGEKGEKALMLCKHCSAVGKTLLYYVLVPSPQRSTILAAMKKVNCIPARPSTASPKLHQLPVLTPGAAAWEVVCAVEGEGISA